MDEFNWHGQLDFNTSSDAWDISSVVSPYGGQSTIHAVAGETLAPKGFVMDQYSCMSEANWLNKCVFVHMAA